MENSALVVLKKQQEFQNLFKFGKRKKINQWLILNFKENQRDCVRFGWTIPQKVGGSVVRNKLKRWCREYFREASKNNPGISLDVNVVIRPIPTDKDCFKRMKFDEFKQSAELGWKAIQ